MSTESKKQEITTAIMKYVNCSVFDISKFRQENPKLYATLPYYFGGIDNMLSQLNLVKVQKSQVKNKVTFRNRLAYDYLKQLREKHTFEEIAIMYGVSRALINQQLQALELIIKIEEIEQKNKDNLPKTE